MFPCWLTGWLLWGNEKSLEQQDMRSFFLSFRQLSAPNRLKDRLRIRCCFRTKANILYTANLNLTVGAFAPLFLFGFESISLRNIISWRLSFFNWHQLNTIAWSPKWRALARFRLDKMLARLKDCSPNTKCGLKCQQVLLISASACSLFMFLPFLLINWASASKLAICY